MDTSEQSLESLVAHIKNFKLSSVQGEDVLQAVSLIKSASRVLTRMEMDCYVDADFPGLRGKEKRSDPDNVRSRAGHVIMLNGAPIVWCSRLIKDVCLSTMMAEHCASSMALREVLPLRDPVKAMSKWSGLD